MASIILLSINSGKRFSVTVLKTSGFTFVRIKKDVPKNVYEVDQELGGVAGELSLFNLICVFGGGE